MSFAPRRAVDPLGGMKLMSLRTHTCLRLASQGRSSSRASTSARSSSRCSADRRSSSITSRTSVFSKANSILSVREKMRRSPEIAVGRGADMGQLTPRFISSFMSKVAQKTNTQKDRGATRKALKAVAPQEKSEIKTTEATEAAAPVAATSKPIACSVSAALLSKTRRPMLRVRAITIVNGVSAAPKHTIVKNGAKTMTTVVVERADARPLQKITPRPVPQVVPAEPKPAAEKAPVPVASSSSTSKGVHVDPLKIPAGLSSIRPILKKRVTINVSR